MEIPESERGKIAFCAVPGSVKHDISRKTDWVDLSDTEKMWWNRVFDTCVLARKIMIPGGDEVYDV